MGLRLGLSYYLRRLTRKPVTAPLVLAEGKNIPREKTPIMGPPSIPNSEIVTCEEQ